jgi:hypothetical protein
MADATEDRAGGIAVRPGTVSELREFLERHDPLESALDLSDVEMNAEQSEELRAFTHTTLRPGGLGWLKSVVVNVASRGAASSFVVYSALLKHANSLEGLAIEGAGDEENEPGLELDELRDRADSLLNGVVSNESCHLKTFKTSIAAASEALGRFLSSPRCHLLEHLDISSENPIESVTLDGLCDRMRYLKRLDRVSIDCADYEDAVALVHAATSHVQEIELRCRSDWSKSLRRVLVPLLRYSSVRVVRLRADSDEPPVVNALEYLSGMDITSSLEVLELDGFTMLDEADDDELVAEIFPPEYNESIQSLRFRNCQFGRSSLQFLLTLVGVTSLELIDCSTLDEMPPKHLMFQVFLPNLPRLERLTMTNFHETHNVLKDLATAVSRSRALKASALAFEIDDSGSSLDSHSVAELVRNCRGSLALQITDMTHQGIDGVEAGLRLNDKELTHFSFVYRTPLSETATADLYSVLDAALSVQGLQSLHVLVDAIIWDRDRPAAILNDDCTALLCRLLGSNALRTLGLGRCQIPAASMRAIVDVLRARSWPLQLHFESVEFEAGTLAGLGSEMQDLTCLEELKVPAELSSDADLHAFLEHLPSMTHLNVLIFEPALEVTPENNDVLVDGASANVGLTEIQGLKYAPGLYESMRRVEFAMRRNRFGWRLLSTEHVPAALWPRVLANIARGEEDATPFLFMFLREIMVRIRDAGESGQP